VIAPVPASGRQFLIRRGVATAQIGQVAAVLRAFEVDGVDYTERWPDDAVPPMGAGIVLMPWPNRVGAGRWRHQGSELQLDVTEPATGNAIHGLLRNTAYQPVSIAEDSVTLAAGIYPQHGYPFVLETSVGYALTDDGLRVEHRVTNAGREPAPFGCGAHPFLRVGDTPVGDLVLTVPARTRIRVDEKKLPAGAEPVAGTAYDLAAGARVADLDLDTAFTDIAAVDGRFEHRLTAPDGRGVTLWADPAFGWVQVFTPAAYPIGGPRRAVAVEPVTCGIDALNTGEGLIWLGSGESWSAAWGLAPFGP
jgi:aldose 1-epimerase